MYIQGMYGMQEQNMMDVAMQQQNMFGYGMQQHFKRYTKQEIIQAIAFNCQQSTNKPVMSTVKLDETQNPLRHSCMATGVTFLKEYSWEVPTEMGVVYVPFYFCEKCGKLYVYNHIYD